MAGESLRITAGNAAGQQIQLAGDFQIGRAAGGQGTLGDDPEISRQHARVTRNQQGQLVVEDLGSTNGTYVNGRRIVGPQVLNPGDNIQVGKSTLQVAGAGGAAPQPTAFGAVPPPPPPGPPPGYAPGPPLGGPPRQPAAASADGGGGGAGKIALVVLAVLLVGGAVAAAVLLLGGDSGEDAKADIEQVLQDTFEEDSSDPDDCTRLGTQRFLEELTDENGDKAVEACEDSVRENEGKSEPEKLDIGEITVDGDKATAEVTVNDEDGEVELAREDGDWKIDDIETKVLEAAASNDETADATTTGSATEAAPSGETPSTTQPPEEFMEKDDPDAEAKLEAVATLEALLQAVEKNDELVICGLLSPRQAGRLVGGGGGDAAIAQCVNALKGKDISSSVPDNIEVTGVAIRGNQASVRLSSNERFTLVRRGGRFVIDSGLA